MLTDDELDAMHDANGVGFAPDIYRLIAAYRELRQERDQLRDEAQFSDARAECAKAALHRMCRIVEVGPAALNEPLKLSENARTFEELRRENERLRQELADLKNRVANGAV